jgi:YegS/Rv2252/BmrU family lipid kinase
MVPALLPALLIANPHSRHGEAKMRQALEALQRYGIAVACPDWQPENLTRIIAAEAPSVRAVIVAGGDGTLNATARGLIDSGLPLGILPTGTANDLARTLGIPRDLDAAARVIADGRMRRIEVGMANDNPFFNVASIGFGVDLTRALTRDSKRRWGTLGYAMAALRTLRRMRPFTTQIAQGDQVHTSRTVHLAVGNGRHYGGGMTIAGDACIDDHRLDVFSLEVRSVWGLLRLLPALRSGHHDAWTEIRTLAGKEIEVQTRRPRSVNLDGEIRTRTPVRFTIRSGAISVYVPTEDGGLPASG